MLLCNRLPGVDFVLPTKIGHNLLFITTKKWAYYNIYVTIRQTHVMFVKSARLGIFAGKTSAIAI